MLSVLVPLLALAGSLRAAPVLKSSPLNRRQNGVVYNCNHDFAYTWDDGPYVYHNEILDHFDGVGKKTTFFVNGNNWSCIYDDDNVQALRRSYEEGHQVASHTWSHADLTQISYAQIDIEIQRLDEAFVKILGVKPRMLRPPYGSINDAVANYIYTKHGKTIVMWSDDSGDSVGGSVQDSVNFYNGLANQGPGNPHLCLSHETEPSGIGALRQGTVENLASHNINMVTVATCIDQAPYEYIGGYGTRDSTWTCSGSWNPPPATSTTSTTSTTSSAAPSCITTYISAPGDTCASIGAQYGLSADAIHNANTFITCNDIWTYTPVCIPPGGTGPTSTPTTTRTSTTTTSTSSAAPSCVSTYTSLSGDTCDSIGAKFGLTGAQILAANSFLNCQDIWTNTPICVPPGGSTSTQCTQTYISVDGDNCDSIGAMFGVSGAQIKAWNDFLTCSDIWAWTPVCVRH